MGVKNLTTPKTKCIRQAAIPFVDVWYLVTGIPVFRIRLGLCMGKGGLREALAQGELEEDVLRWEIEVSSDLPLCSFAVCADTTIFTEILGVHRILQGNVDGRTDERCGTHRFFSCFYSGGSRDNLVKE